MNVLWWFRSMRSGFCEANHQRLLNSGGKAVTTYPVLQAAAEEVDENFPGGIDYLINMAGESNTVLLPVCAR